LTGYYVVDLDGRPGFSWKNDITGNIGDDVEEAKIYTVKD